MGQTRNVVKNTPTKVVVMDFDGPINNHTVEQPGKNVVHILSTFAQRSALPLDGIQPFYDIVINNLDNLKLTFEILKYCNVPIIIGSQRLTMPETLSYRIADLYGCLNKLFGSERSYLDEKIGREISHDLAKKYSQQDVGKITNTSKNDILDWARDRFGVESSSIFLVDDSECYKEPANKAGYRFIEVKRNAKNPEEDSKYLFELLVNTVDISKINSAMLALLNKKVVNADTISEYQRQFRNYLIKERKDLEEAEEFKNGVRFYEIERAEIEAKAAYKRSLRWIVGGILCAVATVAAAVLTAPLWMPLGPLGAAISSFATVFGFSAATACFVKARKHYDASQRHRERQQQYENAVKYAKNIFEMDDSQLINEMVELLRIWDLKANCLEGFVVKSDKKVLIKSLSNMLEDHHNRYIEKPVDFNDIVDRTTYEKTQMMLAEIKKRFQIVSKIEQAKKSEVQKTEQIILDTATRREDVSLKLGSKVGVFSTYNKQFYDMLADEPVSYTPRRPSL